MIVLDPPSLFVQKRDHPGMHKTDNIIICTVQICLDTFDYSITKLSNCLGVNPVIIVRLHILHVLLRLTKFNHYKSTVTIT